MITLYEFRSSPYCEKVRLVLDLKGLQFQAVEVNALTRQEVKAVSRYPTVPVIQDDGKVVENSSDINRYLDEAYPEPPLTPADPEQRRLAALWEDWADNSWGYAARAIGIYALKGNPDRLRADVTRNLPGWADAIWPVMGPIAVQIACRETGINARTEPVRRATLERGFHLLAEHLADREWLVGDALSLADVAVVGNLWELRHVPEWEQRAEFAPVWQLRDRVYERAKQSRHEKSPE